MVNIRRLTQSAQKMKGLVDQQVEAQGGPDALKEKAQRMKTAAQGPGSMGDKAKAAAAVAREKPNPAAPAAGDSQSSPIGGGEAPPDVADAPPVPDPAAPPAAGGAADTSPADAPVPATAENAADDPDRSADR